MSKRLLGLGLAFLLAACSSSSTPSSTDDGDSSSTQSASFPSGLAIASPTASQSANSMVADVDSPVFAEIEVSSSYEDKSEVYATIIAAATDEACQIVLPALTQATNPNCYGPQIYYNNHPDGPDGSPADNTDDTNPSLPTGDLGIWTASQGNGEACTAAKINSLIEDAAAPTDYVMMLSASMVCLMARAETDLPSTDAASVDLTIELNTAVQVNNESVTIDAATMTNLTDIDDGGTTRDAYQFTLTITDETSSEITLTANMKHMPTATDNSTFEGRIWIEIEGFSGAGDKDAIAITYEKASSTSLKYKVVGANYQLPTEETVIFDDDGNIDIGGDWSGNFSQAIINLDPTDGTGDFSYAWQAGADEDKARIFNGFTTATEGCGFFGYGDEFDNDGEIFSDNVIDGFICNWAGPNNNHNMEGTDREDLAQKQCMTISETSGLFEVVSAKNKITYAPVNDCSSEGDSLGLSTTDGSFDTTEISSSLIDLATDTDFEDYTAPTAPSLPSGL